MTKATPTAVKVKDSNTWYFLNHCTKVSNRQLPQAVQDAEDSSDDDEQGPQRATESPATVKMAPGLVTVQNHVNNSITGSCCDSK